MSRVLVTGVRGFLGRRLARALAAAGHEVQGSSRRPGPGPEGCAQVHARALGEPLGEALEGVTALVHGAWDLGADEASGAGTRAWAAEARAAGVPAQLLLSTISARPDAAAAYGRAKHTCEAWFQEAGQPALRLGLMVGDGGVCGRLADLLRRLPVVPLLGGGRHRVWLGDPAALEALVPRWAADPGTLAPARPWALHQPEPATLGGLLRALRRRLRRRTWLLPVPLALARLALALARLAGREQVAGITEANLRGLEQNHALELPSDLASLGLAPRPLAELVAAGFPDPYHGAR